MALCRLEAVKDFLDITGDDGKTPALLLDLINRISAMIESYCNDTFDVTENTEYYDGPGTNKLVLRHGPVTTVSGIWEDSARSFGTSTLIDTDDYFLKSNGNVYTVVLKSLTFGSTEDSIKAVYSSGYATIPYDIEQATIEETARLYKQKDRLDMTATTSDAEVANFVLAPLSERTKMILEPYRRYNL